nr:MAG TPA: SOS-response transcriptional repressor [Caudoviricetes sp.]
MSQTSIKNWKEGARRPHPRHQKRIAAHYGVTVEYLNR